MSISIIILIVVLGLALAWNLYAPFRDKMRGLSTIIEGGVGTALHYFGVFAGAVEEASAAGYVPDNWQTYVPVFLFLWIVMKRYQTTTKLGSDD